MRTQPFLRRAACAGAFLLGLAASERAHAATIVVTTDADSGPGSLRQAILDANSSPEDDVINFGGPFLVFPIQLKLFGGEMRIANRGKLTINSPSTYNLVIDEAISSRVFTIDAGANVTINGLVFSAPFSAGGARLNGGAILNSGNLTINNGGFASQSLDVLGDGASIYSSGTLTVNNAFFASGARANSIDIEDPNGNGGAIYNAVGGGAVTISGCTFNGTYATFGGAIFNASQSPLTIDRSTFQYNQARQSGGAIASVGNLFIRNSTFAGNRAVAGDGGAIYNLNRGTSVTIDVRISGGTFADNRAGGNGGAISNLANSQGGIALSMESCTLSGNRAKAGGGIWSNSNSALALNNSIVALNSGTSAANISGTVSAGDYNLVDNTAGAVLSGTHNVVGKDPQLVPPLVVELIRLYESIPVFTLRGTSPAIDAGNSTLSVDQRGVPRPVDIASIPNAAGGNGSDIGAVEATEEPQSGANFLVNTLDDHDDGTCGPTDCSLREAIAVANLDPDANTIDFNPGVFATKKTLELDGALPPITSRIRLSGPTSPGSGVTLYGTDASILTVAGGFLEVNNLSFTSIASQAGPYRNCLNVANGTAIVNSCAFSSAAKGIVSTSYGQTDTSTVEVNNSTFSGMSFDAIDCVLRTALTLNSCTLTGNGTGISIYGSALKLSNSLVVGNSQENIRNFGQPLAINVNNIVTGSASDVGLSPGGLRDNGGPTPTIALLRGSRAINAGVSSLPTDQRGVARDNRPDIGAFEYLPFEPRVDSLSPLNAVDKVGNRRTFTLTVSDPNGVADIKEVWLLLNKQLSWNAGATLIYVPNAANLSRGQLFLRSGDAFLPALPIEPGSRAVVDNGAISVAASDVSVFVTGGGLTLSITATIRNGLVGTNRVFARVVDQAGSTDPNALASDDGYVRFGNYTVTPQFKGETNSAPTLSRLSPGVTTTTLPSAGLGPVQTFSFSVADADGTGDIESVWFMANKSISWTNSATFIYTPQTSRLTLRSDDGQSFLGGGVVGTAGILENSQVRVDLSKVRVAAGADGKTLVLVLPLQAKSGLVGQNKIWLRVQDLQRATAPNGDAQGYVLSGLWNVGQSTSTTTTVAPSGGGS